MTRLLDRRQDVLLDLAIAAMSDLDAGRSVWRRMVVEVGAGLDATLGAVFDVSWPDGVVRVLQVWPAWAEGVTATTAENRAYPLIRHYGLHRDDSPRTLSEVPDEYRWHTSPRYAAMREQFGAAPRHVVAPLRVSTGPIRLFGFGRPGRDFDAYERDHLRRVQRILILLDRHIETVSTWRESASATQRVNSVEALADNHITPRELAVLSLLADGQSVGTVGRRLGISPRTVTKHQENMQRKLGTRDRLTTVLRAQRLGIV
jgi:DNA-binding CsgD family transcriptional regulator